MNAAVFWVGLVVAGTCGWLFHLFRYMSLADTMTYL